MSTKRSRLSRLVAVQSDFDGLGPGSDQLRQSFGIDENLDTARCVWLSFDEAGSLKG